MAQTLAQQLTSVQTAISAIEGGAQSVQIDGMAVTRADLSTLYQQRQHIENKIAKESRGRDRRVCEF